MQIKILTSLCIMLILALVILVRYVVSLSMDLEKIKRGIGDADTSESSPIISNEYIINNMPNTELIKFIKERFNLSDYCKMCNNFNSDNNNEDLCRWKGLYNTKCVQGFESWLKDNNRLEGDLNADIN